MALSDSDAQAWVDEVFSNSGLVHPNSIDTFFQTLKTDSLWAKLDAFQFIRYGGSEIASRICLKRLTTDTRFGGTWTNAAGFDSDGTDDYINTGFNANSGTPNHTSASASFGVKLTNEMTVGDSRMGGTTRANAGPFGGDVTRLAWGITGAAGVAPASSRDGFLVVSRTDSTTSKLYRNGSALDTDATTNNSVRDAEFFILATNQSTTGTISPANYAENVAECYWIGGGLTDADVTNLNAAINQYFTDAAAETPVDSLAVFSNASPADGAMGVSVTPDLSINNPDSYANLNYRVATDSGLSTIVRDIFATTDLVSIADPLANTTQYHWNAQQYTPGGLVDAYLYEEYFETAQSGWDQWLTAQMQGSGSFSHTGGQGVVTSDPGGQVGAVLDVNFSDIDMQSVIEFTDVTSDLQPTIHFRTQGTSWIGNFIPGYYIYFIGDELRIGRVTSEGSPGDYSIANTTFVRTADTKYKYRIFAETYRFRFAIWPITGSQDGWQIDYTDGSQRYASGGLAVKNTVLAGAGQAEGMAFDYITVEGAQVEQEEQSVDSVTVSPTSATIQPDSTTFITGTIQTSGGLSNAGTWTKVSGDTDLTIQSQSNNNLTVVSSASASDTDSAIFELTADEDGTKSAQTTVTVSDVAVTGSRAGDESALEALWGSTSGWTEDQNWGSNMSLSNDIWGIGVESIGGELRVVHMDLQRGTKTPPTPSSDPTNPFPGNDISGTLPTEIGNLTEIRYCNIKQNFFTGTLPQSMTNWTKCERLLIGGHTREPKLDFYNHPTGGGVSGQSKAIYTTNKFGGVSLPDIFGSMTSLKVFESQGHAVINGNRNSTDPDDGWQGAIPNNWPASLQMLFLGWNNFTGNIPVGLTTTDLHVFHINFNKLSGYIAPHLGNISTMTHIRLGSNNFSSDPAWTHGLPDEWAGFQNLRLMLLEFNDFSGTLPDFMFDGRNNWTEGFRCEFNNFSGTLPDVVNARGNYGSWNVLSFGQNNFSGQVPAWLTQLRVIQLNLDNNNFSSLHPDFYDPTSEIWSGYSSDTSYSRIRNIRLNNNPNLTGELPRPDWLEPRNFNKCRSAGAIAHFGGTQLTQPGPTESGREYNASASDDGASGPIVQKTRENWYKHFWTSTQGI